MTMIIIALLAYKINFNSPNLMNASLTLISVRFRNSVITLSVALLIELIRGVIELPNLISVILDILNIVSGWALLYWSSLAMADMIAYIIGFNRNKKKK